MNNRPPRGMALNGNHINVELHHARSTLAEQDYYIRQLEEHLAILRSQVRALAILAILSGVLGLALLLSWTQRLRVFDCL